MRANTLNEFIGQKHLVAEGSLLRRAIASDRLGSCIFCTVLTLAVYALLRAAAEADQGSEEMYQRMQHKEGRR